MSTPKQKRSRSRKHGATFLTSLGHESLADCVGQRQLPDFCTQRWVPTSATITSMPLGIRSSNNPSATDNSQAHQCVFRFEYVTGELHHRPRFMPGTSGKAPSNLVKTGGGTAQTNSLHPSLDGRNSSATIPTSAFLLGLSVGAVVSSRSGWLIPLTGSPADGPR